ncbi:MAG: acetylornithine deacetylase [Acidocella sp.]|nr:acetylornithine deacetylase [Acidocella sp.]
MPSSGEILARLVGFNTVSREPNEELIRYVAGDLRNVGWGVRALPGRHPGKFNMLASIGPAGGDGIILSGHSDVVPTDGQTWATDPFTLTRRGAKLYGRGAVDMKGFIACALALATRIPGRTLKQPLHIALSHDEEIGCVGVRTMLTTLAQEGFAARGCIIGEPTGLRVACGHKGKISGCICCRGQAAHSANPALGCNAIYLAAGMIGELRDLQTWLRDHGAHDAAYAVPYSTVHVGTIKGGTVLNVVPESCDFSFELRLLPGDDPHFLLRRLEDAAMRISAPETVAGHHASIEINEQNRYPGLDTAPDAGVAALAGMASGHAGAIKIDFGSEAGLFSEQLRIDSIVCGPGMIDRAHKPDEFITQDELDHCDSFLDRIAATLV